MQRSYFIAATAAVALAPRAVRAQALATIRMASAPDEDVVAALWGVESGAFKKSGLDVQISRANSGSAVAAAVAGGSLEVGKSSLVSLLAARNRGLPFVLIAPSGIYTSENPAAGMIVAKDAPYKTGKDMNGKTLGVQSLNDLNAMAMRAWIDANGGDSATAKFTELPGSALPDAVASGRIDAANIGSPILDAAISGGKCRILARSFSAIAPRFMQACYFASTEYIAKNRDVVNRFRRVIAEQGAYANEHHEQMAEVISKFTGIEAKVIAAQPKQLVGTVIDLKLIQPLVDLAAKYKAILAGFDARAMVDAAALT